MVEQFVGTWKLIFSENFDEFLKKLGISAAQRQMASKQKPKFSLSVDNQGIITIESQGIFKAPEIKFKLDEPFEEETVDNKVKTVVTLENGKLIQKMGEMCVEREILDEKLIVRTMMGNAVVVRTFEKEE
ncbi:fatty acid-binding protein 9-like isoform X3 [Cyprinodon tularosa]|uniref:fatty acid-binding protein 9-like isoform X2 n=1 Tax=Cyprinodon tularosa TaxID=77115 RepID=UPI0018E26442|nr:fatty acid-binding protein 9-like isoform X2 [Cyprinodon tularosa]XP_038156229.1 fatty acid-binding protein 9-like isoform X3 [Cyprinodon tularosa]